MIFQGRSSSRTSGSGDDLPLDWTKLDDAMRASILLYRDLIRLRRNWFNQTRGLGGRSSVGPPRE